jgi:hypothetical protein
VFWQVTGITLLGRVIFLYKYESTILTNLN